MTDAIWVEAAAVARVFARAAKVQNFRGRAYGDVARDRAFRQRLDRLTATYSPLRAGDQLLLGMKLNHMPATDALIIDARDEQWLEDAVAISTGFQVMVEFLRSRLPGYPILRVPHLCEGSPHVMSDAFMVRGFPWDAELRREVGPQFGAAPDLRRLGGQDDGLDEQHALLASLVASMRWRAFADARDSLTAEDRAALSRVRREFAAATTDEAIDDAAGPILIERYQYRRAVLEEVVGSCSGHVLTYLRAFDAVNELLDLVASFISSLVCAGALPVVQPYRMDREPGDELVEAELAFAPDLPFHNAGEIICIDGGHDALRGIVQPVSITHKWPRLDDHSGSRMVVSGVFAPGAWRAGGWSILDA